MTSVPREAAKAQRSHKLGRVYRLRPWFLPKRPPGTTGCATPRGGSVGQRGLSWGLFLPTHVPVPGGQNRPPAQSPGNPEWTPVITGQSCALSTGSPAAALCPPCPRECAAGGRSSLSLPPSHRGCCQDRAGPLGERRGRESRVGGRPAPVFLPASCSLGLYIKIGLVHHLHDPDSRQ